MKNYFGSGNGHDKEKLGTRWLADISESMNKTYQKQMDMSVELYNQLIGIPFSREKMNLREDFLANKIYKSSIHFFQKNIEIYADLMSKMTAFTTDSFFKDKDMKFFSDKMFDSVMSIYEMQMRQLKEFNNFYLDALEKNTKGMSLDSSQMIDNFKNNIEENLNSTLKTAKIILKPDNKRLLEEINKEMDAAFKSNLMFWSDLIVSMGKMTNGNQKETKEKVKQTVKETVKETKKEPSSATHKK